MKRFDFANDVAKQLITIASAIVTVVIAFYEKFFSHHSVTFALVFVVLFIFIASIVFGVMAIGGLVNLVERQEEAQHGKPAEADAIPFLTVRGSSAQSCAQWQQILFAAGLALFIIVAIVDRACLST